MGGRVASNTVYYATVDRLTVLSPSDVRLDSISSSLSNPRYYSNSYGTMGGPWSTLALAAGGSDETNAVNPIRYNAIDAYPIPGTNRSTYVLGQARSHLSATSGTVGSHVITAFFGGTSTTGDSAYVDFFNHTSLTVTSLPNGLSAARSRACAASVGQYALYIGGRVGTSASYLVDVFDLATMSHNRTLTLLQPRFYSSATSLGPYIYVAGGEDGSVIFPNVEVIDTRDWSVTRVADLSQPLRAMAAASTPAGAFFLGGSTIITDVYGPVRDIHVYRCGNGVCLTLSFLHSMAHSLVRSLTLAKFATSIRIAQIIVLHVSRGSLDPVAVSLAQALPFNPPL